MNTEKYFYSVLKNEDATPFVGNNVLIAADGLGGAGSTVHNIAPIEGTTLHDEIFNAAFYDFDFTRAHWLTDYLEHWVYPMADGKPDTSALWASRIVIARCAYALSCTENFSNADLADEAVRAQLSKFISIGLDSTALHFRLEKGKYDDQKVLPTTLAFIRYNTDKKGVTTAEVVWAGDSRCYLLTKQGLKQLSIDDEDKSGAITNLFYVGGKKAILNYRKYVIEEPCVLMAVSDGIFDPFEPHDNFGVEKTLLEHIEKSNSYEELMQSLSEFYDKVRGDDATMAFVPIGFDNYKSLKKQLKERCAFILEMWQKFYDMNAALEVADQSEEDIRSYVESRTRDKFAAIMATLLASYKEHKDDLIYTEEIVEKIVGAKAQLAERQKQKAKSDREFAINGLRSYLKAHIEEKANDLFKAHVPYDVPSNILTLLRNATMELNNLQYYLDKSNKRDKIVDEKANWRKIIREKQYLYWHKFDEAHKNGTGIKQIELYVRLLKIWMYAEVHFEQGYYICEVNSLESEDKRTAKEINDFIYRNKTALMTSTDELEKSIAAAQKKYCDTIDKLFDALLKMPSICGKVFKEEIVKKYALSEKEMQDKGENSGDTDLSYALASQKDDIVEIIVNALAKHYDKTSILDCYYNATRLNTFRAYYKLKMQPNTDIAEFEIQLKKLEAEYERLTTEE